MLSPGQIGQIACVMEVTAEKAGNVHKSADFDDCGYIDFLISAQAIGPALDAARTIGVGSAVLEAIRATRRLVSTNTNLGMVLLMVPMAAADPDLPLREGVKDVLRRLTQDDATKVYHAIRMAAPGGIGKVEGQDLGDEPTVTLLEAMTLAADRDLVARQYANAFAEVFDIVLPALERSAVAYRSVERGIVAAHLHLLARVPDTLIARKRGMGVAIEAMRRAERVLDEGWPNGKKGLDSFVDFDLWLRADGHARNPGASADLVAAALFVAIRSETIPFPMTKGGRSSWAPPDRAYSME